MAAEYKDERVRRTLALIDAAFVELLRHRGYAGIHVSDITKKAGVGRATFYAHYSSKDDLLRSQFERGPGRMISDCEQPPFLDASQLIAHIGSAPHFYWAMMGPKGGSASRVLRGCFEAQAQKALAANITLPRGLKLTAIQRFVASSLLTIIECWLEQGGRERPEQVQALFATLVGAGLREAKRQPAN